MYSPFFKNKQDFTILLGMFSIFFLFSTPCLSQNMTASDIIKKCISKHDPSNNWPKMSASFQMKIVRDGHETRNFTVSLDNDKNIFEYAYSKDTIKWIQGIGKNGFYVTANTKSFSKLTSENITKERTQYLKEVYNYLLGLPMVLHRDVDYLLPDVKAVLFNGSECYQITIAYQPKSENETWYFYIDKTSFLLKGYEFFLEDESKDGEYIYLNQYQQYNKVWIPTEKLWFWNKDNSYFRTDTILEIMPFKKG